MSVKLYIKRFLPKKVLSIAATVRSDIDGVIMHNYDTVRFKRHYSNGFKNMNKAQVEARLMFYAHSIEKGLSHDEIRYGFGKNALNLLAIVIKYYNDNDFDKLSAPYRNALSVIKAYIEIHKACGYDISYLNFILGDDIVVESENCIDRMGGITCVKVNDKENSGSFESVFNGRSSIREFSPEPVDIDKVKNAIQFSMKSPSVCNRQSSRVYVITNKSKIEESLKIQGGMTGYDTPPLLLVVTSCLGSFLHLSERNQPFVDGGLFSMSLLLSLEKEGLAACPLNAMFNKKQDIKARSVIGINQDENFIMYIAVGNFKNISHVAKSFRYLGDGITTFVD